MVFVDVVYFMVCGIIIVVVVAAAVGCCGVVVVETVVVEFRREDWIGGDSQLKGDL